METERFPWGGFYERLVGLVKRCLKNTIGKAYLNMIKLNTLLIEVEAVLNIRPLACPRVSVKKSDPDYIPTDISTKELTKRAKYHEIMIQAFWTRWQKEYLTSLREYNSYQMKTSNKTAVAIGDVVLIHDNIPLISGK